MAVAAETEMVVVVLAAGEAELLFEAYMSLAYKCYQNQNIEFENQHMNHTLHKKMKHKALEEHEAMEAQTSNY